MARINQNYNKLTAGYLFPEIARRTRQFLEQNPQAKILKLGIGDTTEALTPAIVAALHKGVDKLANVETYSGYCHEQGNTELREALVKHYQKFNVNLKPEEFFVSDGAKPDTGNIQSIFAKNNIIAVQDPVYPVYVDTNVIAGRTGNVENGLYQGIVYMPCTEENNFFPNPPEQKVDIIYLCSPNNPTGMTATKEQLEKFVAYAKTNKAVIIYDSAYATFITNSNLPRSIYEIPGAKECAIEISSFSKDTGFTGVRLGWTIVPKELVVEDTEPGKVHSLWYRRQCTFFNGASRISQEGGLAALSGEGREECQKIADYYMENARIIREGLQELGLTVFGGVNCPYIWVKTPNNMNSWEFFDKLLQETNVVGTPGSGFGPGGEGYFRLSAFGHKEDVLEAVENIKKNLKL